jgi:hypothetical protein
MCNSLIATTTNAMAFFTTVVPAPSQALFWVADVGHVWHSGMLYGVLGTIKLHQQDGVRLHCCIDHLETQLAFTDKLCTTSSPRWLVLHLHSELLGTGKWAAWA